MGFDGYMVDAYYSFATFVSGIEVVFGGGGAEKEEQT